VRTARSAAATPVAAETAHRVLRALGVRDGETLLVHGAAGSVGELTVQLALAAGARVIGTASAAHQDRVRALGATPTAYGAGWPGRVRDLVPGGVDAVFDASGAGVLEDSIALRGGTERVVTIADAAAFDLGVEFSSTAHRDADELATDLVALAHGGLRVTVARVFPLGEAAAAHALVQDGHPGGKVVLVP
jgi:NADPH:quinone reductase-like Zn-dependent oxidoreductase